MSSTEPREILMECSQIGSIVRVAAVDARTGAEVVFQAPANTPRLSLQKLAASKLHYVINKQKAK